MPPVSIFWFRRDLRLHDNAGLYHALKGPHPVLPLFIFDREILDDLPAKKDARVEFIHRTLHSLKEQLAEIGSVICVRYGRPLAVWADLLQEYKIAAVYTNRDYEPYAQQRDNAVEKLLKDRNVPFFTHKDHVIFEKSEVTKDDGSPYTVFTPYSKKWLSALSRKSWQRRGLDLPGFKNLEGLENQPSGSTETTSYFFASYPVEKYFPNFLKSAALPIPPLAEMGFEPAGIDFPSGAVVRSLIKNYDKTRDFPAQAGTSRLGIHFRFGTISIREKARHAQMLNTTYLNELIWRDFYSQILANFPRVAKSAFKPDYDRIPWRDAPEDFEKWREGRTGYPLVDAGMRELNATGFMHNRVRMVAASFLTKHLLLDWRLGEAYFAEKLLDFDLASNNGGWQWAAGSGTDAAPYFRIFNPSEQAKKFDPDARYIRKWVPEYGTPLYPRPMVEHTFARERCLETYKKVL